MCSGPGESDTIHHSGGLSHLEIDHKLDHTAKKTRQYVGENQAGSSCDLISTRLG